MRLSTLGYVGKQGLRSMGRNRMFSMASIATMSACIFLFGLFFSILLNMQHFIRTAEEGVAITVFFDEGVTQAQIDSIGEQLRARPEVGDVIYVSADEAWEKFKHEYFGDNLALAEGFRQNPLIGSDNFEVYMKTTDESSSGLTGSGITDRGRTIAEVQRELVSYAEQIDGVRRVNRSDIVANTLSNVNVLVGYVSAAIILILFGVSTFLISNTVTMGITVRREEIAIMKYIGAKDFVVRSPFVIEGLLMGLAGSILPLILLFFLYQRAVEYINTRFALLANIISFLDVRSVYLYLLPIGILLGVGIGFIGSYSTVRKHLKV